MQIGAFVAKQTVLECPNGCAMFASKQLRSLVPYKCTYGFDIIEHVGMALFVHCQNGEEIIHEFAGSGYVESGFTRHPLGSASKTNDDISQ